MAETEAFRNGMALHTSRAVDKLSKGKHGDTITREQMTDVIGRECSPGTKGYGNVNAAIKHTITNHRVTWAWSRASQAWLCLDDAERVTLANVKRKNAARQARRGISVCQSVDETKLDDAEKHQFRCQSVLLGAQAYHGGENARKKLMESHHIAKDVDNRRLLNALLE